MDEDINEEDLFNPHDDAEPFLRDILRHGHGRLAPSLHRLVTLLRDTLPIVVELEAIRRDEEKRNHMVDVFPKAAGWYRLLYGDLRCVSCHSFILASICTISNSYPLQTCTRLPVIERSTSSYPGWFSYPLPFPRLCTRTKTKLENVGKRPTTHPSILPNCQ